MEKFNQLKSRFATTMVSAMQTTKIKAVQLYNSPAVTKLKTQTKQGIHNGRVKLANVIMPKA